MSTLVRAENAGAEIADFARARLFAMDVLDAVPGVHSDAVVNARRIARAVEAGHSPSATLHEAQRACREADHAFARPGVTPRKSPRRAALHVALAAVSEGFDREPSVWLRELVAHAVAAGVANARLV